MAPKNLKNVLLSFPQFVELSSCLFVVGNDVSFMLLKLYLIIILGIGLTLTLNSVGINNLFKNKSRGTPMN